MDSIKSSSEGSMGQNAIAVAQKMSAVDAKISFLIDSLQHDVAEVRSSVQMSMSRAMESLRSREMFLLSQVDIMQQQCLKSLLRQQSELARQLLFDDPHHACCGGLDEQQSTVLESSLRSMTFTADLESLRQVIYRFGDVRCEYKSAAMKSDNLTGKWQTSTNDKSRDDKLQNSVLEQLIKLQDAVCDDDVKHCCHSTPEDWESDEFVVINCSDENCSNVTTLSHETSPAAVVFDRPTMPVTEELMTVFPAVDVYVTMDDSIGCCITHYSTDDIHRVTSVDEEDEKSNLPASSVVDLDMKRDEHFPTAVAEMGFTEYVRNVLMQPIHCWLAANGFSMHDEQKFPESLLSRVLQVVFSHPRNYWLSSYSDLCEEHSVVENVEHLSTVTDVSHADVIEGSDDWSGCFQPAALDYPRHYWLAHSGESPEIDLDLGRTFEVVRFNVESSSASVDVHSSMKNTVDEPLFHHWTETLLARRLESWLDSEILQNPEPESVLSAVVHTASAFPIGYWLDGTVEPDSTILQSLHSDALTPCDDKSHHSADYAVDETFLFPITARRSLPFGYFLATSGHDSFHDSFKFSPIGDQNIGLYSPLTLAAFAQPHSYWLADSPDCFSSFAGSAVFQFSSSMGEYDNGDARFIFRSKFPDGDGTLYSGAGADAAVALSSYPLDHWLSSNDDSDLEKFQSTNLDKWWDIEKCADTGIDNFRGKVSSYPLAYWLLC